MTSPTKANPNQDWSTNVFPRIVSRVGTALKRERGVIGVGLLLACVLTVYVGVGSAHTLVAQIQPQPTQDCADHAVAMLVDHSPATVGQAYDCAAQATMTPELFTQSLTQEPLRQSATRVYTDVSQDGTKVVDFIVVEQDGFHSNYAVYLDKNGKVIHVE